MTTTHAPAHSIVLLSGGMDSAVLVGHLLDLGHSVDAVGFDYGQRHRIELVAAQNVAAHYGVRFTVVDLTAVGRLLSGSALTDPDIPVPLGHYEHESMKATVVPNRNAIMLNVAAGVAVARHAQYVATAVHAGDHAVYPDCRPEFITAVDQAVHSGTAGFGDIHVVAPFVRSSKTDIARLGGKLAVPFGLTWSCYQGGDTHCGLCGTCTERIEAFQDAGVDDPTTYAAPPAAALP